MAVEETKKNGNGIEVEHYRRYFKGKSNLATAFKDQVAGHLIQSPPFQRLADISFLGAISYVRNWHDCKSEIKESRFDHSIGVAKLGEYFATTKKLSRHERELIVASALLHDIGHPPLSHSAEPAFKERFGLDHHELTENIIMGEAEIAHSIPRILSAHGIAPEEVLGVLNGQIAFDGYSLFSGPFNLDTLEGISRCNAYMAGTISQSLPPPTLVLQAAQMPNHQDCTPILDCFWKMKDRIYNSFIRSEMGIRADNLANTYFKNFRGNLVSNILLVGETLVRKSHPKLFERLFTFGSTGGESRRQLSYIRRNFIINLEASPGEIESRYIQTKTPATLDG